MFKPKFTIQDNVEAKKLAKMPISSEILQGHHQAAGNAHKYQVALR